jgi:hypothetical protein
MRSRLAAVLLTALAAACGRAVPDPHHKDLKLVDVSLEPAGVKAAIGEKLTFTLLGRYEDGSAKDLSQDARFAWASSAVDVASAQRGGASTLAAGRTDLTVSGLSFGVKASVEVVAGHVGGIRIMPGALLLVPDAVAQLQLQGKLEDGSWLDLAGRAHGAVWTVDPAGLLDLSPDGLATGGKEGSGKLGVKWGAFDAQIAAQTRAGESTLYAISITPDPLLADHGQGVQTQAVGFYSNGALANVTGGSTGTSWRCADPKVADVNPNGVVGARIPGKTSCTATNKGITGSVDVNVR